MVSILKSPLQILFLNITCCLSHLRNKTLTIGTARKMSYLRLLKNVLKKPERKRFALIGTVKARAHPPKKRVLKGFSR